jgi:hypothetical protein
MVCLRNISVDTLYKGDTKDDYDDDDNNNNNNNIPFEVYRGQAWPGFICLRTGISGRIF